MNISLPTITRAKLILTERCQLNCKYCYETHGKRDMSLEVAIRIIDSIYKNSLEANRPPRFSFFGGEPLLVYEELMKPCIEYIRNTLKSRGAITFTTNGILLDEEKLKYFKSMNVQFMLSIDGCEEAHDASRVYKNGSGSFSDVEKNIDSILKYFPNTMARMTVTPDNIYYLYDSIRYLESKGFSDIHIVPNLFVDTNRDWTIVDFEIARHELAKVSEYIIDTFERGEVPVVFRTLEDMFSRIVLADYSEKVNHYRRATCCSPAMRCGIGVLNNVIFDVEGNVFSCQHGSQEPSENNPLYLGNLDTGILEDRRLTLLDMNSSEIKSTDLDCTLCPLYHICTGGCVPNNYLVTGDFNNPPTSYCYWMRVLYETALSIIEHFDKEKTNTLFKDYFYGVVKRGVICVC